ncbi:PREDICTED: methanol O-anthraniloyltransferase-like [Ipomoea nil]|uniref:methanol O-anthraniloyltransferase-like n=1 Tax=Ipomoea nil TaxID=35883 RepID=UPI00090130B7|nr:PREDICTED: methanol O-anthraniloyltransferase-like [Ipomoea nil]
MACLFPPRFSVRLTTKPELVTPKTPTPREKKPLSDIDDQASLRYHMPGLWFYENKESMVGKDPAKVIKEGLAKALVFFYPLAGRLTEGPNKKLIVDCNGEGVLFVTAEANIALHNLGDFIHSPCPYLKKLQYNVPGSHRITGCPLLLIQVTRFSCGGFALGVRFNHTMVDGYGIQLFLKAVCELAQGGSAPSVLPVWGREMLTAAAAEPNTPTTNHAVYGASDMRNNFKRLDIEWWGSILFNFEKLAAKPLFFFFPNILKPILLRSSFVFGPKEIQALKDQAAAQDFGPCTTFELISACLWKCRTIALQPNPNATVRVTFPTDIRRRSFAGLKFDPGYYGNAIIMLSAATTAKLLCERPITYAIELIREAKNKVSADYVKSVLDFLVINGRPRMSVMRNILVSDISRIGLEKIDFGWGDAIYAGSATAAYGATFLERPKSNSSTERSVLVPISLPHLSMLIFKREIKKMTKFN